MSGTLNRWTARQKVSATHLNEVVDFAQRVAATPGFNLYSEGTPESLPVGPFRQGRVVAAGPAGEADWDDERYWVEDVFVKHPAGSTERSLVELEAVGDEDWGDDTVTTIRTVTNWPEILSHTHGLQVGTAVLYVELQDATPVDGDNKPTGSPNRRFAMFVGGVPAPQYQYQTLQGVANGKAGYDMNRAHPLIPVMPPPP